VTGVAPHAAAEGGGTPAAAHQPRRDAGIYTD